MGEFSYEQVKAAQYMARLLKVNYFSFEDGDNFFEYLCYIGGNFNKNSQEVSHFHKIVYCVKRKPSKHRHRSYRRDSGKLRLWRGRKTTSAITSEAQPR